MALPKLVKQPAEVRTATFDFGSKLAAGDSLTGTPTVTVATGLSASAPVRSGNTVTVRFSGGTNGTDYAVSCTCATSGGDTLELDALVLVRADEN